MMSYKLFITQIPASFDKEDLLGCFNHDSSLSIEAFIKGKGFYKKKRAVIMTSNFNLFRSLLEQNHIKSPDGSILLVETFLEGESLEKRV